MKTYFSTRILIALAVAAASLVCYQSRAGETTAPPPANGSVLPPEIQPGTPAAEVLKLVQASVNENVIQTYISNCASAFNLDANKIVALSDAGVPGSLVNAMMDHDRAFMASLPTAAPQQTEQPAPPQTDASAAAQLPPPPTDMTMNYFYDNLAPYGVWVQINGYGRCWRPNVILYDANWRPYCDRGHWVYTDCGWYWDSDYAWGVTFHYGRWFNDPRYGWCWWPNTVWAPSWVTWRSDDNYCGWAPLPPLTVYQPGIGFLYRGKHVAFGFDFGLSASCFTFVSTSHFCDPRPRYYCVPPHEVRGFFGRTRVINDYGFHNRSIVNNGVSVTVIGHASRHPIQPVSVGTLRNHERYEWHGSPAEHRSYGGNVRNAPNNRSFNGSAYQHENRGSSRDANANSANPQRHEYNRNRGVENANHSSYNNFYSPRHRTDTTRYERDRNTFGHASRDNFSVPRPGSTTTTTSPVKRSSPAASLTQNQTRNNWSNRGNVSHHQSYSANRNQLRQPYHPAVNNAPRVAAQAPRHEYSRPNFSPGTPRVNSTPSTRSWSAPVQSHPQNHNGGNQGEYARKY